MYNTQSPTEEHLDYNDPNVFFFSFFALHCHLGLRHPTFTTVSWYLKTRLSARGHGKGAERLPEMDQECEEDTDFHGPESRARVVVPFRGGRAG